jgi:hypothetical protein
MWLTIIHQIGQPPRRPHSYPRSVIIQELDLLFHLHVLGKLGGGLARDDDCSLVSLCLRTEDSVVAVEFAYQLGDNITLALEAPYAPVHLSADVVTFG